MWIELLQKKRNNHLQDIRRCFRLCSVAKQHSEAIYSHDTKVSLNNPSAPRMKLENVSFLKALFL